MKSPKHFLILLIITLVSCTKKTKDVGTRNDSVEKYLKLASIDTLPIETRRKYNAKAFSFIDLEKNDTTVRWYLSEISLNNSLLKDSLNFHKVSNIYYSMSLIKNDTLNMARFLKNKAIYHKESTFFLDSSFFFFNKSEKLFYKINKELEVGKILYDKASLLSIVNDFSGAELHFIRAKRIFKKYKSETFLINLSINFGNVYAKMLESDKAIKEFNEGLLIINKSQGKNKNIKKAYLFTNISKVYFDKKRYQLASKYLMLALNIPGFKEKNLNFYSYALIGLADCKLGMKQFNNLESLYEEGLKYSLKINDVENIYEVKKSLSNFYFQKRDTLKAKKYSEEALIYAKKINEPYKLMNAYRQIGIVDKERASEAIIQFDVQVDSLLNKERRERSKFLKIQLETDEIAQEKEKAIKQKWVQTSIIATVLLIVILLFIIFKQRAQKKEFVLIQNQQKANEEIYQLMLNQQVKEEEAKQKEKKRIALELHDNVMNKLASTRFNLFALTQQQDDTTLQSATQSINKIKEVEDEIRNLTHVLAKETFARNDSFASLLDELIRQQNQVHTTPFTLTIDPKINWDDIGSEVKMNYYRIIQEALHNTNKHAQANQGEINIQLEHNQLQLTLTDNGVGFDVKANPQGIGLQNMQQRMELIGGTLSIRTAPGKGTAINCSVLV